MLSRQMRVCDLLEDLAKLGPHFAHVARGCGQKIRWIDMLRMPVERFYGQLQLAVIFPDVSPREDELHIRKRAKLVLARVPLDGVERTAAVAQLHLDVRLTGFRAHDGLCEDHKHILDPRAFAQF